jgi:hypothetical protein
MFGVYVYSVIVFSCVEALERVDLPSKESYQLSKNQETGLTRVFRGCPMLQRERHEFKKIRRTGYNLAHLNQYIQFSWLWLA